MQRRPSLLVLILLLLAAPLAAQSLTRCTAENVRLDIEDTLVGGVEISSLRISWSTDSEGPDLDRYEIWSRGPSNGKAKRLAVVEPSYSCPHPQLHEVVVHYHSDSEYYVEIHTTDRGYSAVLVPVH